MKLLIEMLLLLAAAACLVPVVVLTIEILLAPAVGKMAISAGNAASVPFVVIVPAHNEELTLAPTLQDIRPQLGALGRLVVVADNCSDDTAAVAERAGAEVVSRNDPDKRGKGYALDAAVQFVERPGPP